MMMCRTWAMPNHLTFQIKPIAELLQRHIQPKDVVIDPFARDSMIGTYRNDLNPETKAEWHLPAEEFCELMRREGMVADVVLFDPPYSSRQIKECYEGIGLRVSQKDTQMSAMCKAVKYGLDKLLRPGGIAISCGWNSSGFPKTRGYERIETLLVCHGAAHYDTIVCVDRKPPVLVQRPDESGPCDDEFALAV